MRLKWVNTIIKQLLKPHTNENFRKMFSLFSDLFLSL